MRSTNLSFWLKWILALLLMLVVSAWGGSQWYLNNFTDKVADRLQLLNELRQEALQQYFTTAQAELNFWSTNTSILTAQAEFSDIWPTGDASIFAAELRARYLKDTPWSMGGFQGVIEAQDDSGYTKFHDQLHPMAKLFVSVRGYYDVFLIGTDGDIYYSVEKEDDFATNLNSGEWRNSGLADVFARALKLEDPLAVATSDMESYAPSAGAAAIFMAKAMRDSDAKVVGVIAFQLPTSGIVDIMNYASGMGETGETYLVGQDLLMRSDSRFSETSTVLLQKVDTVTVGKALAGGSGIEYGEDYRGVEVLSAYTSISVGGSRWAVMAEIDRAEVEQRARDRQPVLGGALFYIFGLSLWSIWYWRGGRDIDVPIETASVDIDGADFGDSGG